MATFTDLIPQNVAPPNAASIGAYRKGVKVCDIDIGHLAFPTDTGERQYRFGAISDVHIGVDTSESDFATALSYFQGEGADFVCIAGDLTNTSTDEQWQSYKDVADSSGATIYPIGGNHDAYGTGLSDAKFRQYTGFGTFYTIEHGDDIFIMLSQVAWASQSGNIQPFYTTGLQSLYNALEQNRNKRCFVFIHPFAWGKSGDPFELYSSNALWGTQGQLIYVLMAHYKNALWFHGHSHHSFESQKYSPMATYDYAFGCHSVHIPSVTKPVDCNGESRTERIEGSQGYTVDVYEKGIHLIGRDFIAESDLPIASYWLDTTLQTIEAGTFTDSTGTITT